MRCSAALKPSPCTSPWELGNEQTQAPCWPGLASLQSSLERCSSSQVKTVFRLRSFPLEMQPPHYQIFTPEGEEISKNLSIIRVYTSVGCWTWVYLRRTSSLKQRDVCIETWSQLLIAPLPIKIKGLKRTNVRIKLRTFRYHFWNYTVIQKVRSFGLGFLKTAGMTMLANLSPKGEWGSPPRLQTERWD